MTIAAGGRPPNGERRGGGLSVAAVEAEGLVKTYRSRAGSVEAVRGVDLRVESGEVFGFLGPNGAGKSTTVRMLTTLLSITAGTARVAGLDVAREPDAVRRRIGGALQEAGLDPRPTGREPLVLESPRPTGPDLRQALTASRYSACRSRKPPSRSATRAPASRPGLLGGLTDEKGRPPFGSRRQGSASDGVATMATLDV